MNDNQLFPEIASQIQKILPVSWKKVCLYADVSEESYELFYYVFVDEQAAPIQCYQLPQFYDIFESDIDNIFSSLAKILRTRKVENNETWTVFTFILTANGSVDVYYDYDDHSEDSFIAKRKWKQTYLKI